MTAILAVTAWRFVMRSLSNTLALLRKFRAAPIVPSRECHLSPFGSFGSNPGELEARIHVPAKVSARPALVVVLHGCTQTAATYDAGSGWTALADDQGFVVLFPQQTRSNNANLCFN